MTTTSFDYAGFWVRAGATIIDWVLIVCVTSPLLWAIYGPGYFDVLFSDLDFWADKPVFAGPADFVLTFVAPAIASIVFWLYKQATPGKLAVSAYVVDARTGKSISVRQAILRYCGYLVAIVPLGLGILWVAFDARKQGWHDKLAGTVVLRGRRHAPASRS